MSVFAPTKLGESKVHYSQYIRTEIIDRSDEPETAPAEKEHTEATESK